MNYLIKDKWIDKSQSNIPAAANNQDWIANRRQQHRGMDTAHFGQENSVLDAMTEIVTGDLCIHLFLWLVSLNSKNSLYKADLPS